MLVVPTRSYFAAPCRRAPSAGRQVRALGAVSLVIIVRAECGLVFRGLDVEVANQAHLHKSESSAARLPSSSPRASHSRCIVASISEKSPDGALPLLPIEAAGFSKALDGALPLLPLEFFRHYWQYAAGRFLEFRGARVPSARGKFAMIDRFLQMFDRFLGVRISIPPPCCFPRARAPPRRE
jgi:hypothetical protein